MAATLLPESNSYKRYGHLALLSFAILYLELTMIRWLASEIRIFAYFKNLPLFACFLGFGIGCVLADRHRKYFRFAPVLLLITVCVIGLAPKLGYTHLVFADPFEYYLIGEWGTKGNAVGQFLVGLLALGGVFMLAVALFTALASKLGHLMNQVPALPAYSVNVVFSLLGVIAYAALSWLRTPPAIWVLVAACALAPFFRRSWNLAALALCFVAAVLLVPPSAIWSPYYRLDTVPVVLKDAQGNKYPVGYNVQVNHDSIAGAYNHSAEFVNTLPPEARNQLLDYYNVPYRIFGSRFRKVLVLGAGPGNDVAAALRNGAEHVDAVEIDPAIVDLGRKLHAEKPYDSKKVAVEVMDARTFLSNPANSGYDLIVFGALDSHAVFSSMSSVRLDNYVYTVESFRDALKRLSPDGVIAVTFYFYKRWQVERVYNGLWRASTTKPVVVRSLGEGRNNFVMLAGPGAARKTLLANSYVMQQNAEDLVADSSVEPTTDDWPFLYLQRRGVPTAYISVLVLLLGLSYLLVRGATQLSRSRFEWPMFLLGTGFMLLETKILAKIGLLLGATWTVNTFVIAAILLMIVFANIAVSKEITPKLPLCFAALLVLLAGDWLFHFNRMLLPMGRTANLYFSLLLLALPALFAGIAFALLFRGSRMPSMSLGYNLFGAMFGGVLEYCSTAWGINNLNLICGAVYLGAALFAWREMKVSEKLAKWAEPSPAGGGPESALEAVPAAESSARTVQV